VFERVDAAGVATLAALEFAQPLGVILEPAVVHALNIAPRAGLGVAQSLVLPLHPEIEPLGGAGDWLERRHLRQPLVARRELGRVGVVQAQAAGLGRVVVNVSGHVSSFGSGARSGAGWSSPESSASRAALSSDQSG